MHASTLARRGLLLAATLATLHASAQPAADPQGRWLTASGNLEVEIAPCGDALCGTVTKVIANHSMSRPGEAMQAADARPALGMRLLADFVPTERTPRPDGSVAVTEWRGHLYNRENAKTYDCLMSMDEHGGLVLRGYIGLPVFGKTQVWQRLAAAGGQP
jgi:uncharacterized protein (DUF2147 family)